MSIILILRSSDVGTRDAIGSKLGFLLINQKVSFKVFESSRVHRDWALHVLGFYYLVLAFCSASNVFKYFSILPESTHPASYLGFSELSNVTNIKSSVDRDISKFKLILQMDPN